MRKLLVSLACALVLLGLAIAFGNDIATLLEGEAPSASIGTADNGRLVNGKRLPTRGENFVAYSYLGALLGRNAVHDRVRTVVLESYAALQGSLPDRTFVYGETGWPSGGSFRPHRTHQNGLSVDFMVPVVDAKGRPALLPASVFNTFGYGVEFDRAGRAGSLRIDYEAAAAHLYELHRAARRNSVGIRRVIFDMDLHPYLFETGHGRLIRTLIHFDLEPPWIRHDEHYHVDFIVETGAR